MCGGGYCGGPELLLLIPLLPFIYVGSALAKIPEETKKKYEILKRDIDLKLKTAELALDDQKTNLNKESKFSNHITIQMEKAFMYSILGDFKKTKETLLEVESNQPYFYVPSLLLAQYYYAKKKFAKAVCHAELALFNYSTRLDFEGEIRVARDQFQSLGEQFTSFGKHLQDLGSKIENRTNMFFSNFGETLKNELTNGLDRTRKLFKSQQDCFSSPEEFYDIIGLIYYDNRMYPEAMGHFITALEAAKTGDRTRLGQIYFHSALCSLFLKREEDSVQHAKNALFHGWNGNVIHALNSLALRNLDSSKSQTELGQAIKGDSHVKEAFYDLLKSELSKTKQDEILSIMVQSIRNEDTNM